MGQTFFSFYSLVNISNLGTYQCVAAQPLHWAEQVPYQGVQCRNIAPGGEFHII